MNNVWRVNTQARPLQSAPRHFRQSPWWPHRSNQSKADRTAPRRRPAPQAWAHGSNTVLAIRMPWLQSGYWVDFHNWKQRRNRPLPGRLSAAHQKQVLPASGETHLPGQVAEAATQLLCQYDGKAGQQNQWPAACPAREGVRWHEPLVPDVCRALGWTHRAGEMARWWCSRIICVKVGALERSALRSHAG